MSASGGKTWSAGLSGNTIILGAGPVSAGLNKIDPGQSLTLTFSAMASCSANTYTLTTAVYQDTLNSDGSVNTATPYTLANSQPTVTVTGACDPPSLIGYCTFTQGGWGADPAGNNPGQVLASYFSSAYPGGSVQVGGTHSMMFTSAAGVDAYLPAGGPPSVLSADYSNPTSTSSGVFGGQVLALRLNVNFQSYIPGASNSIAGLKLKGTGTSLNGSTVPAIEAAEETALGGGALPAGFSISTLNTLIDSLNSAFDGCTTSDWANAHLTTQ